MNDRSRVVHLAAARGDIPGSAGEHAISVLHRGNLDVALSAPTSPVERTPHAQDEIYIVVGGRAVVMHNGKREPCEAGDLIFVAAGIEHQFEDLSEGFAVWRVFYGPAGGEIPI